MLWAPLDCSYPIPKHRYIHQNRDFSYARAQVMAKYVISMAAILNMLLNEIDGWENLTPIFLVYLTSRKT